MAFIWLCISLLLHKSVVGGRHSVRLQRFDEVVSRQFSKSINEHVLDMLNTRYLITPAKGGQPQAADKPEESHHRNLSRHCSLVFGQVTLYFFSENSAIV